MRSTFPHGGLPRLISLFLCGLAFLQAIGQSAVTAITTSDSNLAIVTYNNRKGAGLRNSVPVMTSSWDSAGSNRYTLNFNASATADITLITQATIAGLGSTADWVPVTAAYKIRRRGNAYINTARQQFNAWMRYSSAPAAGSNTGTFDILSPDVTSMEAGFASRNINSGYDNVFSNNIGFLHAGNVERIDMLIPSGLYPYNITALSESGFIVYDRGGGDPFRIAAIDSLDPSGDPARYLSLVTVAAASFGGTNLVAASNYVICYRDSMFYSESRPSTMNSQAMRGVFISLSSLGITTVGKQFYGISIFGSDVTGAMNLVDWMNFPSASGTGSEIDIVNNLGLYRTPIAILPMPLVFEAKKIGEDIRVHFRPSQEKPMSQIFLEYSVDNLHFRVLQSYDPAAGLSFDHLHKNPAAINNYYRIFTRYNDGSSEYSQVRLVCMRSLDVVLYPNPAGDRLNLQFDNATDSREIYIELLSPTGKIIKRFDNLPELQQMNIDTRDMPSGLYLMRLYDRRLNLAISRHLSVVH